MRWLAPAWVLGCFLHDSIGYATSLLKKLRSTFVHVALYVFVVIVM